MKKNRLIIYIIYSKSQNVYEHGRCNEDIKNCKTTGYHDQKYWVDNQYIWHGYYLKFAPGSCDPGIIGFSNDIKPNASVVLPC